VTSYRQMRRHARRVGRGGLQPIMIINADSQLPTYAAVILARWAWRYHSELAPACAALAVLGVGWWLHATHPHWWAYILAGPAVAAWALVMFGARIGLARLAERIYAATATYAAGAWLVGACLLSPFASPLPQVLGLVSFVLAIPWWAHRRRRANVRVQRTLAAWPDISQAIGLPGSQVMSAAVDLWGWRARLRLARGQTIADVSARIPATESALGTFRGALRVYPTRDDKANR
jgi:S-DNA-T family DNA segregation ATPase FtsK/SpoIIIE